MVAMESVDQWLSHSGSVVSWHPTPSTVAVAAGAPISAVPPSYQQAQHLRGYRNHDARGTEMARLCIAAWDVAGQCDKRAMTYAINAHLRRHDTYRSWFEYTDSDQIVRRTIEEPADIAFAPKRHGQMSSEEWRTHILGTPDPWQWDCFRFGIIQRADDFTFYVNVDHLHADAMFMVLVFVEIQTMYAALVAGKAPIQLPEAGSYHDFCVRQHEFMNELTAESSQVQRWAEFAGNNGGSYPRFPLPLGDPALSRSGDILTVELMDGTQTDRFEAACEEIGARFSGGVFACSALAHHEFTGAETYSVITPTTTRSTPAEFMTTGWFTGVVPITVAIDAGSFGCTARAAQASFDSGLDLANVPFDRVLELTASELNLTPPGPGVPMLSYLDIGLPPLSPEVMSNWAQMNGKIYSDARSADQIGMWVNRSARGTSVTVAFPNNPIARESVTRYVEAMKSAYVRVAAGAEQMSVPA